MTQRTHDIAAISLVSLGMLSGPLLNFNWATLMGIGISTIIGAIVPDIDNVASPAWRNKLSPFDGKLTQKFLEGHRHLSHSLLGGLLFTWVLGLGLQAINTFSLDIYSVQKTFALGFISHLIMDTLTVEGVPWLYPIPFKLGFPPFRFLRIKSGGLIEKTLIFPLLIASLVLIYYVYHDNLITVFSHLKK